MRCTTISILHHHHHHLPACLVHHLLASCHRHSPVCCRQRRHRRPRQPPRPMPGAASAAPAPAPLPPPPTAPSPAAKRKQPGMSTSTSTSASNSNGNSAGSSNSSPPSSTRHSPIPSLAASGTRSLRSTRPKRRLRPQHAHPHPWARRALPPDWMAPLAAADAPANDGPQPAPPATPEPIELPANDDISLEDLRQALEGVSRDDLLTALGRSKTMIDLLHTSRDAALARADAVAGALSELEASFAGYHADTEKARVQHSHAVSIAEQTAHHSERRLTEALVRADAAQAAASGEHERAEGLASRLAMSERKWRQAESHLAQVQADLENQTAQAAQAEERALATQVHLRGKLRQLTQEHQDRFSAPAGTLGLYPGANLVSSAVPSSHALTLTDVSEAQHAPSPSFDLAGPVAITCTPVGVRNPTRLYSEQNPAVPATPVRHLGLPPTPMSDDGIGENKLPRSPCPAQRRSRRNRSRPSLRGARSPVTHAQALRKTHHLLHRALRMALQASHLPATRPVERSSSRGDRPVSPHQIQLGQKGKQEAHPSSEPTHSSQQNPDKDSINLSPEATEPEEVISPAEDAVIVSEDSNMEAGFDLGTELAAALGETLGEASAEDASSTWARPAPNFAISEGNASEDSCLDASLQSESSSLFNTTDLQKQGQEEQMKGDWPDEMTEDMDDPITEPAHQLVPPVVIKSEHTHYVTKSKNLLRALSCLARYASQPSNVNPPAQLRVRACMALSSRGQRRKPGSLRVQQPCFHCMRRQVRSEALVKTQDRKDMERQAELPHTRHQSPALLPDLPQRRSLNLSPILPHASAPAPGSSVPESSVAPASASVPALMNASPYKVYPSTSSSPLHPPRSSPHRLPYSPHKRIQGQIAPAQRPPDSGLDLFGSSPELPEQVVPAANEHHAIPPLHLPSSKEAKGLSHDSLVPSHPSSLSPSSKARPTSIYPHALWPTSEQASPRRSGRSSRADSVSSVGSPLASRHIRSSWSPLKSSNKWKRRSVGNPHSPSPVKTSVSGTAGVIGIPGTPTAAARVYSPLAWRHSPGSTYSGEQASRRSSRAGSGSHASQSSAELLARLGEINHWNRDDDAFFDPVQDSDEDDEYGDEEYEDELSWFSSDQDMMDEESLPDLDIGPGLQRGDGVGMGPPLLQQNRHNHDTPNPGPLHSDSEDLDREGDNLEHNPFDDTDFSSSAHSSVSSASCADASEENNGQDRDQQRDTEAAERQREEWAIHEEAEYERALEQRQNPVTRRETMNLRGFGRVARINAMPASLDRTASPSPPPRAKVRPGHTAFVSPSTAPSFIHHGKKDRSLDPGVWNLRTEDLEPIAEPITATGTVVAPALPVASAASTSSALRGTSAPPKPLKATEINATDPVDPSVAVPPDTASDAEEPTVISPAKPALHRTSSTTLPADSTPTESARIQDDGLPTPMDSQPGGPRSSAILRPTSVDWHGLLASSSGVRARSAMAKNPFAQWRAMPISAAAGSISESKPEEETGVETRDKDKAQDQNPVKDEDHIHPKDHTQEQVQGRGHGRGRVQDQSQTETRDQRLLAPPTPSLSGDMGETSSVSTKASHGSRASRTSLASRSPGDESRVSRPTQLPDRSPTNETRTSKTPKKESKKSATRRPSAGTLSRTSSSRSGRGSVSGGFGHSRHIPRRKTRLPNDSRSHQLHSMGPSPAPSGFTLRQGLGTRPLYVFTYKHGAADLNADTSATRSQGRGPEATPRGATPAQTPSSSSFKGSVRPYGAFSFAHMSGWPGPGPGGPAAPPLSPALRPLFAPGAQHGPAQGKVALSLAERASHPVSLSVSRAASASSVGAEGAYTSTSGSGSASAAEFGNATAAAGAGNAAGHSSSTFLAPGAPHGPIASAPANGEPGWLRALRRVAQVASTTRSAPSDP